MDNIFLQVSVLLGITISVAFLVRLLKQPLLIAYIIAGIAAGPLFLNLMRGDGELYHAFSEFGIVLLLFVVGLSLNFDHIKKIGKISLFAGLSQFVFTALIGMALLRYMDFSWAVAIYLALAITFSSTIIIVKLLNDKDDTHSLYGRYTIGLMVVQDLLAITTVLIISSIGGGRDFIEIAGSLFIKVLALGAAVPILSRFVLPKILDHVARSSEFLFIFTVTWCFGVASVLHWLGFSLEIGAIVAGLSLGSSPYQAEISSRIRPLRDFFIIIFFVILGSQMKIADVAVSLIPAAILSVFILFGNPFILYHSFRFSRFTRRNSFLAGITAAQVSEFGFVLLFAGISAGHISGAENELSIFTIVALSTIFCSTYAITYGDKLFAGLAPLLNFFGKDKYLQTEDARETYDVWVFGYHRIGWKICEALMHKKIKFAVIDFDPKAVGRLRKMGIPAYFGDASDVEFLESLPLDKAKLVISTLPGSDDQLTLVKHIRSKTDKTSIVTNLYHVGYLEDLYEAGANYVMMPHLMGGHWMANVLMNEPWTKKTFDALKQEQKQEMNMRSAVETLQ